MRSENAEKRRFSLRQSDKIILGIVALMVVVIIALGILQRVGLALIKGAIGMYLPIAALFVLVGWGVYALVRRISRRGVKIAVGIALGLVLMIVLMLVYTYVGFIAAITVPQKYATITSPSGQRKLAVMRALDPDEERIETRKAARLADDPDGDPDVTVSDWGYIYRAYPQVLGLFYRIDADVEGEIYLAYDGQILQTAESDAEPAAEPAAPKTRGTLMVEWQDDESAAHFFVKTPGVAEGGECTVRFEK